MLQKYMDTITKCTLFEYITQEELFGLLPCMDISLYEYKRNVTISIAGQDFTQIGLILEGNVALTKETLAGNRVLINVLGPSNLFGEMAAFSGKKTWPVTVTAQTNCTILFFNHDKMIGYCEKACIHHKKLILNMLKLVSNRALLLNRKLEYLSIKSLRSKICTYLLEEHQKNGQKTFQMHLNRNELADFINVSRPSLSRELGKMRDEGLIDFHSTAIKIHDFDALRRYSQ